MATVGNPSEGREEKVAHGEGTEPNYPLAVLVNGVERQRERDRRRAR